jgi:hypothetical protein
MNHHYPPLFLELGPADESAIKIFLEVRTSTISIGEFLQIEKPHDPKAPPQADNFSSIAQFYEAIENAIATLFPAGSWFPDTDSKALRQFAPGLGYSPRVEDTGSMTVVNSIATARQAVDIVIRQGNYLLNIY